MSLHRAVARSDKFSDDSPMDSWGNIGLKRISRNQKNKLFDKNLFTNSVLKDKKRGFDLWSAKESIALNRETGAAQRFAGGLSMLGQAAGAFGGARMDAAADEASWNRWKDMFGGGSSSGSFGTSLSGGEIRDLELSTGANSSNGFYLPQAWN